MKINFKEIIATVAPALAAALGGPLAGMATRAIAGELLGNPDAGINDVEMAIANASGPDLVKLKELDVRFKSNMAEAQVDLERIAADDRNSARERQVRMADWTPSVLGLAIILGFFGVLAWIFQFGLPDTGSEVLLIMVGALGAMTTQVGNYFFGSSTGSKSKDTIIANLKGGAP
ncbi:MAG: hypothetical protein COC12_08445 [Rhodobacteraceae bacterium]|nr:MAG: hypothetical protein COC12_08445 [Paracoccaceae bacterium]